MISICEAFAEEYNILFNPSKSKLMYFNVTHAYQSIHLCSQPVNVVPCETYLGDYIRTNICDRSITQSVCSFSQITNKIIADFLMLDSFSLYRLLPPIVLIFTDVNGGIMFRVTLNNEVTQI